MAYLGRNHPRYFEFLLGAVKVGAVLIPLNWRLAPAELAAIIGDAQVRLVVADKEFWEPLAAVPPADRTLRAVVGAGADESAWPAFLASGGPGRPDIQLSEIVPQLYTSGTTGRPKGVMTSGASLDPYLDTLASVARIHGESTTLSRMPLFHIGGTAWVLCGIARGATSVLLATADPEQILDAAQRYGVTNLIAVPTIIAMILASPRLASATSADSRRFITAPARSAPPSSRPPSPSSGASSYRDSA